MQRLKLVILGMVLIFAAMASQTEAAFPCDSSYQPVTTCGECFYFGQWLSYECTTFCQNGSLRRVCGSCGSGCPK